MPSTSNPTGGEEPRSPRRTKVQVWEDLLRAATEVFGRVGYTAASLDEIAERAGVPQGSIYFHVRQKIDLLEGILEGFHEERLTRVRQASVGGPALARLQRMLETYFEFTTGRFPQSSIYWQAGPGVTPQERERLFPERMAFVHLFAGVLRDGQGEGVVVDMDATLMAQSIILATHSMCDALQREPEAERPRVARQFVALLVRGHAIDPAALGLRLD